MPPENDAREKENPYPNLNRSVLEDWPWAFPTYEFTIEKPMEKCEGGRY